MLDSGIDVSSGSSGAITLIFGKKDNGMDMNTLTLNPLIRENKGCFSTRCILVLNNLPRLLYYLTTKTLHTHTHTHTHTHVYRYMHICMYAYTNSHVQTHPQISVAIGCFMNIYSFLLPIIDMQFPLLWKSFNYLSL